LSSITFWARLPKPHANANAFLEQKMGQEEAREVGEKAKE
jgi:hypothetical protein